MITQDPASCSEKFFEQFYTKGALVSPANYRLFKDAFRAARELTYSQKTQIFVNVIPSLCDGGVDLIQRVCNFVAKCGISTHTFSSEAAIQEAIENIIAVLVSHPFSSKKFRHEMTESVVYTVPTSSEAAKQAAIDKEVLNFKRQECVKRLVPFTYELIRQDKIFNSLDIIIQAFLECSIELKKDPLIKIHEENPAQFIVELSTQLCSSDGFLEGNAFEAVKYCFPHVKGLIPAFLNCLSRLNLQNYSYMTVRNLLDGVFTGHYVELSQHLVNLKSPDSLLIRAAFAETIYRVNPNYLAICFLYFFSEEEIFNDFEFSPLLLSLWRALIVSMENREDQNAFYCKMVNSYLRSWSLSDRIRTCGTKRIKFMLEEQKAGKQFTIDKCYPIDTPLWRQIGFLECVFKGVEGIDRLFKLDWDFDVWNLKTSYAMTHKEYIQDHGLGPELYHLLFPALVAIKDTKNFPTWYEELLGYRFRTGPSGVYMTLPEPSAVFKRWNKVLEDPRAKRVYRNLSIIETEGSATVEEYLGLFMKYDVICSKTSEFVHDHLYHLLAAVRAIMNSSAEAYHNSIRCAREEVSLAQKSIQQARENPEFATDTTMLKILELTLGIFVDIYLIKKSVEERNLYFQGMFCEKKVLSTWRGVDGDRWRRVFKEFNITHELYPAIRIQEYWDRIVKGWDDRTFDRTPLMIG